jgi:hypothetical protein
VRCPLEKIFKLPVKGLAHNVHVGDHLIVLVTPIEQPRCKDLQKVCAQSGAVTRAIAQGDYPPVNGVAKFKRPMVNGCHHVAPSSLPSGEGTGARLVADVHNEWKLNTVQVHEARTVG